MIYAFVIFLAMGFVRRELEVANLLGKVLEFSMCSWRENHHRRCPWRSKLAPLNFPLATTSFPIILEEESIES